MADITQLSTNGQYIKKDDDLQAAETITQHPITDQDQNFQDKKKVTKDENKAIPDPLRVDMRYISEIDINPLLDAKTTCISSPIATGKTELINKTIQTAMLKTPVTALVLTYQTAQINHLAKRLEIDSVLDVPNDEISQLQRFVITHKKIDLVANRSFDMIFIDDFEQYISHLGSDKHANRRFAILLKILANAKQVFILDAHVSNDLIQHFLKYTNREEKTLFIENTFKPSKGVLKLYTHKETVVKKVLDHIRDTTGRIVIITSDRKLTKVCHKRIAEKIGEDKVYILNGGTSTQLKTRELLDKKEILFPEHRVIICSSTIASGFNIQAEVEAIYGVFPRRNWQSATTIFQQLLRFRNAVQYHIYVQRQSDGNEITDANTWYRGKIAKAKGTEAAADFHEYNIDPDHQSDSQRLKLQAISTTNRAKQRNELSSSIEEHAKLYGFKIEHEDEENLELKKILKQIERTLEEENKEKTLNLPPITKSEYLELQRKGHADEDTQLSLLRGEIEKLTGRKITEQDYELLKEETMRGRFKRFLLLDQSIEVVQAKDRKEAQETKTLADLNHYTKGQQLACLSLLLVYGNDAHRSEKKLSEDEILDCLKQFLDLYKSEIKLYIDGHKKRSQKSLNIFRRILDHVGLKLKHLPRVTRNGKRVYQYELNSDFNSIVNEVEV